MNIEPHETAIRTADGWAVYDSWNQSQPTFVVGDGIRERKLLKSLYHNPELNPAYKEDIVRMYADTIPLMEKPVHRLLRAQRNLLKNMTKPVRVVKDGE